MKKNILTVLAVLFLANIATAQESYDLYPPAGSMDIDSSQFHSTIDTLSPCKGLIIRCGVTSGNYVIMLHLLNDISSRFIPYPILACEPINVLFDKIKSTGTTVNLDSIIVLLRR
jgi:hypothetical protein